MFVDLMFVDLLREDGEQGSFGEFFGVWGEFRTVIGCQEKLENPEMSWISTPVRKMFGKKYV